MVVWATWASASCSWLLRWWYPVTIFAAFAAVVKQPDGTELYLANASSGMGAVPCHLHHCGVVWHERSCYSKASIKEQLPVLKRVICDYEPAVSGNLRFLHRLLRGLCDAVKTQFPDVQILQYAFRACLLVRWRVLQVVHYLTVWAELVSRW